MPDGGIVSITDPIEIEIVEDRIHFTCISGQRRHAFAISFHKARNACHVALRLLDKQAEADKAKVAEFKPKRGRRGGH